MLQNRYSLYVLSAAILAAAGSVLTEIALRFYAVSPFLITFLSNIVGGLILLIPAIKQQPNSWRGWPKSDWIRLIVASLAIYAVGFLLIFMAIHQIGAGKVILLSRLEVIFIVILAVLFLDEPWSTRHWLASFLALGGTILINFDPSLWQLHLGWGELLTFLSSLIFAGGIVTLKPLLDRHDGQLITGIGLLLGAIFISPFFPFFASANSINLAEVGWVILLLMFLMGMFRGLSWSFYNSAMPHLGASRCSVLFLSVAFFTVILQVIVAAIGPGLGLQVPPNLITALLGGLIIVLGIILLQNATE